MAPLARVLLAAALGASLAAVAQTVDAGVVDEAPGATEASGANADEAEAPRGDGDAVETPAGDDAAASTDAPAAEAPTATPTLKPAADETKPATPALSAPKPTTPVARPSGPPARVHLNESLRAAYHLDNGNIAPQGSLNWDPTGSNYVDWLNILQLNATWDRFTAQVRMDSALYLNAPQAADDSPRLQSLLRNRYENRLGFEKVRLGWSNRWLDVTLGDVYATYGRGLVLSLRKVDEFGIDVTARGLSVTGRAAGLTVNALAGVGNIVNVDPATGRWADDPGDIILAGRADYRIGRWVTPGFNVSHVIHATAAQQVVAQQTRDSVTTFSGTVDVPAFSRWGTLYAEVAGQRRLTNGTELWTWAMYATGSAFLGPVTLLAEYKDYRTFSNIPTSLEPTEAPELALNNFYSDAPTLERVQQVVLNNTDVMGPHLRASYRVSDDVVPFVSMAFFVDRTYRTHVYDPYVGVEARWNGGLSRLSAAAGYRLNQYDDEAPNPGQPFEEAWHAMADVTQHLTGPWALEANVQHLSHRDEQGFDYLFWNEGQVYLSAKHGNTWSVSLGYEYYTQMPTIVRSHYFNVGGSWRLSEAFRVRAFIGGQRAGIKCVGGVCRNFPAFDGAQIELVSRY